MDEAKLQIVIPTYNCIDELDITIQSIWSQDYKMDNIYVTIIDFGSTDGTYEKAIEYLSDHVGIYSKAFQKNWRQRLNDMANILEYVKMETQYSFFVVLYPGDKMYPECLRTLANAYRDNYALNPAMVLCESDIIIENEKVIRQKPLFSANCIIDGTTELKEYVNKGYDHQIFTMMTELTKGRRRNRYENNEGRCWNKLIWKNIGRKAIYIKEPLVCTKRIQYPDELQEILYRWESYVDIMRRYNSKYGMAYDTEFIELGNENLAEYALWRCFCMYEEGKTWKEIEDCFLISTVIDPKIEKTDIYRKIKCLLEKKDNSLKSVIKAYYSATYHNI